MCAQSAARDGVNFFPHREADHYGQELAAERIPDLASPALPL
jgi:hypothetical protein